MTGGAGFIGSHLVETLVRRKEKVRVLDNLSTGSLRNLSHIRGKFDYQQGDIRDQHDVRQALKGVTYVLHEAALRSVARSVEDPVTSNDVNVNGTVTLLWESLRARVKRVVYASSSSVYGESKKFPQSTLQPAHPVSPYAVSKYAAEQYCRVFSETLGLSTVSLRYFNVFGPRQDPLSKYAVVIPIFMHAAYWKKALPLDGDGRQSRDFAYIENVVWATLAAAMRPGVSGDVFNVACGQTHSLNDYIRILEKLAGRKMKIVHRKVRVGDVKKTWADISKTKKMLGYRPLFDFEGGIRKTWDYFSHSQKGMGS